METLAPHSIVEIENRRFDSWRGTDLIASSVELTSDKTGEGCVELYDPAFKIIDEFLGGGAKPIQAKFWFNWKKDVGNALFVGRLARVEWSDQVTTLRFHDFSSKMKQQKKTRYFKKKSDLQILKKLAEDNDLKFSAKGNVADGQPLDSLMQSGITDWQLALKIGERAGLRLYVRGDTLYAVEAAKTGAVSNGTLILEKDFTLLRGFNLSYKMPENKKGRAKQTEVRARAKDGKRLVGKNDTGGVAGTDDLIVREDLPKPTVALLNRRASGKSNRRREYAFEHHLVTLPTFNQIVELRNTLTLGGMGKFFSGNYIVTDIRYSFRPGQLTSEMTVGSDLKK